MLELEKRYTDEMIAHAQEDSPNECCGILAGDRSRVVKLYRMTNTEHSPYRYNMDAKELMATNREIDDNDWDLLAIYHSHTHSPAYPSDTDVRLSTWPDGRSIWPAAYYILVSLMDHSNPAVRAFRIVDGQVIEEELRVL